MSENKSRKSIAIILVNWNQKTDLIECISSIKQNQYSDYKIIIVDNNSSDGSIKAVREVFNRNVEIIKNNENVGYSKANNIGLRYALRGKYDFIMLLNTDTIIADDCLKNVVGFMEENADISAISPLILFYDNKNLVSYAGGIIDRYRHFVHRGAYQIIGEDYFEAMETDFLTGCCLVLRAEILRKCKLFDDRFFMYFEDTDLSMRLRENGKIIYYFPESKVWHKVVPTKELDRKYHYNYYMNRNRLLLIKKHQPEILTQELLFGACKGLKSILEFKFIKGFAVIRAIIDFLRGRFGKL